jgi:HSP20 family protein
MFRQPFYAVRNRPAWTEMERLQREMNRLFAGVSRQAAPAFPAMNIWANEEGLVVTAELPGVEVTDIDISVVGDTLTLSGTRQPETLAEGERYHRRERRYGKFSRAFQLPCQIDANKVEAVFEKGILQISLPRVESEKPKKIAIRAA